MAGSVLLALGFRFGSAVGRSGSPLGEYRGGDKPGARPAPPGPNADAHSRAGDGLEVARLAIEFGAKQYRCRSAQDNC
jgi:hypothetical protein